MRTDAIFYYIVWVIVLMIALAEHIRKKPFHKPAVATLFMVAAVLVACRVDVGADWSNYKFLFYNGYEAVGNRDASLIEPLFMLIRAILYGLGFTHSIFFFVLSLLSLFAIRKAAKLFGIKYFMTVFLVYYSMFFLNYQCNIVRHGVMASFVWLSFAYRSRGEIKAAIISILVALGFHITALLFVPFLFLLDRKYSMSIVFIALAVSYAAYFLHLSERVMSLFPFLYESERMATYVVSERYTQDVGLTLGSQLQVFLFIFLYLQHHKLYNKNPHFRFLLNALLFDFVLLCFLNSFSAIISRVCNTFFMAMVFLLPMFWEKLRIPSNRIIAGVLVTLYLFLAFPKTFVIQEGGYSEMLPYRMEIKQLIVKQTN